MCHNDQRVSVDIEKAERPDIEDMLSLFNEIFRLENPRLAELMYTEDPSVEALSFVVEDILKGHLDSRDRRVMIA